MNKPRITTEKFIVKSKHIHGDLYIYDKVNYINSKTSIILICKTHGEFKISPNTHISRKAGCQKCALIKRCDNSKTSFNKFLISANDKHNHYYDYSLVSFENTHSYINIICKTHGVFVQRVSEHLFGKGCRKCYTESKKRNYDDFVKKAKSINGDLFNYNEFKYIDSKTPSIIICNNGHKFKRTSNRHLSKPDKCPECSKIENNNKYLLKLNNIGGFKYEQNNGEKYNITCEDCERTFNRKVSEHLKLKNCIYCKPSKDNSETFIKKSMKIHKNFNYDNVVYIRSNYKVDIICNNGHEFSQIPNNHLNGVGCPKCRVFGVKEKSLCDFIVENYNGVIKYNDRTILNKKELDIYLPELNLAFEFNGLYWHSDKFKEKNYHLNKTNECLEKNVELIHIWEDDWEYKTDIVKSIILNKLGKCQRIFARKCEIKTPNNKEVREFLNNNHIQGFVGSNIKLGLYFENELVSLMTFGSLRKSLGQKSIDDNYEMLRFCNKLNTTVVGGASKLFKYFLNNYDVKEITSYSDNSRGIGNLYTKLGFEFSHNSLPNYYYIINSVRKHRFNYRKDKLIREGGDPNKTEVQIMNEKGYFRIFDSGCKKWTFTI